MKKNQPPVILAIDTSCDDTSVAVTQGLTVLSNIVASQTDLHRQYGGVFPTVAKQAHRQNIEPSILAAIKRAKVTWQQIDAVAVTQGPGLAPALEVGIAKAKELAKKYDKPLVAVNHIEGHMLSALAERNSKHLVIPHSVAGSQVNQRSRNTLPAGRQESGMTNCFPILAMVVSGGHTEFILIKQIGEYEVLGSTIDDAAGECLDKVGRILNLGYPAGPTMEKLAKMGNEHKFAFPLPMTTSKDFNLSFSGLKTYARRQIETLETKGQLDKQTIYDFAASFQYAVFRHITYKLSKVFTDYPNLGQVWLGGGVAANIKLREMIRTALRDVRSVKTRLIASLSSPYSKSLCSDNAAMIGVVAGFKLERGEVVKNLDKLERKPRWKIGN